MSHNIMLKSAKLDGDDTANIESTFYREEYHITQIVARMNPKGEKGT